MKKRIPALVLFSFALSLSLLSSPFSFAGIRCEKLPRMNSQRLVIADRLTNKPSNSLQLVAPFSVVYSELAPEMAQKKVYVRRATEQEAHDAIASGLFPHEASVMESMFVLQEGQLDYNKKGQVQVAFLKNKPKKWNENFQWEKVEAAMIRQMQRKEIVSRMSIVEYRKALTIERPREKGEKFHDGMKADRIQFITLQDGTKGVFKSESLQQAVAEVAAYKLARLLGIDLVPPTVMVSLDGKMGSFQYLIESPTSGFDSQFNKNRVSKVDPISKSLMEIFYIVSGNWDAHPGNRIEDSVGGLGLIDNEAITRAQFYRYGEIPWIPLFQIGKKDKTEFEIPMTDGFPFDNAKRFHKPTLDDVLSVIGSKPYDIEKIKQKLPWYQNETGNIGFIEWNNILWVQLDIAPYYFPRIPEVIPQRILKNLQQISIDDLRIVLQEPFREIGGHQVFNEAHLIRMKQRIDSLIANWNSRDLQN